MNAYERVAKIILDQIEAGTPPWRKTWVSGLSVNIASGNAYQGVNQVVLSGSGMGDNRFGTLKQWHSVGARVKDDQIKEYLPVVYTNWLDVQDTEDETKRKRVPFLKFSCVYSAAQVENPPEKGGVMEVIPNAEAVVFGYTDRPSVKIGSSPLYRPSSDTIEIPDKGQFETAGAYYSVLFHELAHSTGASHRLARGTVVGPHTRGDVLYAEEELVAEISSAMLIGRCQLDQGTQNSASYCNSWLSVLDRNMKIFFRAAKQAEAATQYILKGDKQWS